MGIIATAPLKEGCTRFELSEVGSDMAMASSCLRWRHASLTWYQDLVYWA
jgi:hypothetical protein